jgi:hypothetical protein
LERKFLAGLFSEKWLLKLALVLGGTIEGLMEVRDFETAAHKAISIKWAPPVTSETIIMIATLFQNPNATRIKRSANFTMSVVVIAKQTRLTSTTPAPTRRLEPI